MPTTSARRLTSLFNRSSGFVEWILVRCWTERGTEGIVQSPSGVREAR
jgi:hypothetical protein